MPPKSWPLSVVVPTTHPWPAAKAVLEILTPQCAAGEVEIVLADSTGEGLPEPRPQHLQFVRWVVCRDASVFGVRAKGTEAASGAIVAWTEDHCRPAEDWCARMIQAHAEHPEADMVGGAMLNASVKSSMDWANFLFTFGPFLPPLPASVPRVPVAANLSFKRRAIPDGPLEAGQMEFEVEARLWREGRVFLDDRIVVRHVQSWGFWGTPRAHFHNGRSTAGLSRWPWATKLRRLPLYALLPMRILRIAAAPVLNKPGVPALRCLPHMAALALAHSAGEIVGLLTGAGRSPHELE